MNIEVSITYRILTIHNVIPIHNTESLNILINDM